MSLNQWLSSFSRSLTRLKARSRRRPQVQDVLRPSELAQRVDGLEDRTLLITTPVSHWNFDEGPDWHDDVFGSQSQSTIAHDTAGQNHATLRNMDPSDWVSGRQFTGLQFDGQNDYLETSTNIGATLGGTASLSFWIQTNQTGGGAPWLSPGVTGVEVANSVDDIFWGWLDDQGRVLLSVGDTLAARGANPINDGRWHHVVITRDATSGVSQIFLDGQLSEERAGPTGTVSTPFRSLGRIEDQTGSPHYFDGRLDQIYVFDSVINAQDVTTLQQNHAPKAYGTTSIVPNDRPVTIDDVRLGLTYDVESDDLSVHRLGQPAHGSVTFVGGSFVYEADSGYLGTDHFDVIITDDNGGYSSTTMTLLVTDDSRARSSGAFRDFQPVQANGSNLTLSGRTVPRAFDWDGDGDSDLLVSGEGSIWLYENTGTPASPVFAAGARIQVNQADIVLGSSNTAFTLADLSGDGVMDLIVNQSGSAVRLYINTSAAGQVPVFGSFISLKASDGADLQLGDWRFDIGDYNSDGLPDIVQGSFGDGLTLYANEGTSTTAVFGNAQQLFGGAYNLYPRLQDINGDNRVDLVRGINWGDIVFWLNGDDDGILLNASSGTFGITDTNGNTADVRAATDGAIVDFSDLNGDGVLDMIVGGHLGGVVNVAMGHVPSDNIDQIEGIYDANLSNLGNALSANDDELLKRVNAFNKAWIAWALGGFATHDEQTAAFNRLVSHINKYPEFLKHQQLDTDKYHHLPSIQTQNWITLHQLGPDTATHRSAVADAMGALATEPYRPIYEKYGLVIGDNHSASAAQLDSISTFMLHYPRALFPDTNVTINNHWGDGNGGRVESFTGAKNIFDIATGTSSDEWAADLRTAIQAIKGPGATRGDIFTFVLAHEAVHSMDKYIRERGNEDLERRWGRLLVDAGGPDIIGNSSGWFDRSLTQQHFLDEGLWDGVQANWSTAWNDYWDSPRGQQYHNLTFMRGAMKFFLDAPQESLATQGNQHWVDSEARLIGAIDRFERGYKTNLTEVVTFIDFVSAGMNRIPFFDIDAASGVAAWNTRWADLERDDYGHVTTITVGGKTYQFGVDEDGIVQSIYAVNNTPALDAVSNVSIAEDASEQTVSLGGISAGGGESQPLRITAVSEDSGLIPAPTVTYTSAEATGSLKFQPVADQFGSTTITVTVEDGGLDGNLSTTADNATFSRVFTVSVDAVNDVPSLDPLSDLTIDEDASEQTVVLGGISAGGGESQPLRVTAVSGDSGLIPAPTVTYTSAEATGSLKFQPVADQFGSTTITVTVEDGGLDNDFSTTADNATTQRQFTVTVTAKPVPEIITPGEFTNQLRPRISWTAVTGAVSYQVWIGNSSTGVNPFVRGNSETTFFDVPVDLGIGKMDLWVRGVYADGTFMPWTDMHRFNVVTRPTFDQMPTRRETARPTLSWGTLPGAISYDLWINNISTGESQVIRTSVSDTAWTPSADLPMSRYRAWIRGQGPGSFVGEWSIRTDFYIVPAPEIITPIQPTFDLTPSFNWSDVAGATSYGIFLRYLVNGSVTANINGLASSEWTPAEDLPSGSYAWWAIAESSIAGFRSAWSPRQEFYVGGLTTITSPSSTAASTTPLIQWLAVTGADHYVLQVNGDTEGAKLIYRDDLTDNFFQVINPLVSGRTYRLWVKAISNSGQHGPWTATYTFTVATSDQDRSGEVPDLRKLTSLTGTELELFDPVPIAVQSSGRHPVRAHIPADVTAAGFTPQQTQDNSYEALPMSKSLENVRLLEHFEESASAGWYEAIAEALEA